MPSCRRSPACRLSASASVAGLERGLVFAQVAQGERQDVQTGRGLHAQPRGSETLRCGVECRAAGRVIVAEPADEALAAQGVPLAHPVTDPARDVSGTQGQFLRPQVLGLQIEVGLGQQRVAAERIIVQRLGQMEQLVDVGVLLAAPGDQVIGLGAREQEVEAFAVVSGVRAIASEYARIASSLA